MRPRRWFLFDLGNVLIRLAYERMIAAVCDSSDVGRDELLELMEKPGGYRDLERGAITFHEFYDYVREATGYSGSLREFEATWSDFFDGPVEGIEGLLERVRLEYRVAYISNSNEVHAALIPRTFAALFRENEPFFFSHEFYCAKPDPQFFQAVMEMLGAAAEECVVLDDLIENVVAARSLGIAAVQFTTVPAVTEELERAGLLTPRS
jgi:FMN phosphatase YigB (HAD superfamily)